MRRPALGRKWDETRTKTIACGPFAPIYQGCYSVGGVDMMGLRMRKAERYAYISRRASELAATGDYQNWHEIETALRFMEGWHEARDVLDSHIVRELLDVTCQRATGKPAYGDTFLVPSWERPRPW
jgi:hypothetical protein